MMYDDWEMTQLLEQIGAALGMRLGRKHYFSSLIVPIAVREWVARAAAQHPEVAELLAAYEKRKLERAYAAEDQRQQRQRDKASLHLLGTAPDDAAAIRRHGVFEEPDRAEVDRHMHALLDLARAGNRAEFLDLFGMVRDRTMPGTPEWFWQATRKKVGLPP
jgi:hypothetical protein